MFGMKNEMKSPSFETIQTEQKLEILLTVIVPTWENPVMFKEGRSRAIAGCTQSNQISSHT